MAEPKKKLSVRSGDTVVVITGKDKGKTGKIQRAYPQTGKIIVEGVAMVKRHQKPRGQAMPGGIITKESAIPASSIRCTARFRTAPRSSRHMTRTTSAALGTPFA